MAARSIECEPRARPPRTISTSQKLWLGFGTLTALLLLFGVTVVLQILSTEGQVRALATVTRERTAATQALEAHVLHYSLAVRTYWLSGIGACL